jgi:hypothetical protein
MPRGRPDTPSSLLHRLTLRRALVVAAVLGVALAVLGSWLVASRTTRVVGARRDLSAGDRVLLGDVVPLDSDRRLGCDGCLRLDQAATLVGATLVRDVPAGTPITARDVTEAGPGPRTRGEAPQRRRGPRGSLGQRRSARPRAADDAQA